MGQGRTFPQRLRLECRQRKGVLLPAGSRNFSGLSRIHPAENSGERGAMAGRRTALNRFALHIRIRFLVILKRNAVRTSQRVRSGSPSPLTGGRAGGGGGWQKTPLRLGVMKA